MQPHDDTTHLSGKVGTTAALQSKVAMGRGRLTSAPRRSGDGHQWGGQRRLQRGPAHREADEECATTLDQRRETHGT
jgi:hypothetical protein